MKDLVTWLNEKLQEKDWTIADLSRACKDAGFYVAEPTLWRVIKRKMGAGVDTCNALAKVFDVSPVTMFRMAGLLPEGIPDDLAWQDFKVILSQLSEEQRNEYRKIGEIFLDRQRKEDPNPTTPIHAKN